MAANQAAVKEDRVLVAMAKVKPLGDEIENALTGELYKQTVVFGWHIEPLEMMVRSLRARGFTAELINGQTPDGRKQSAIAAFKAGQVQVICANILTAGTSIDLSAASHGYFLELDWVPGSNVQAANRLISMDKAEPVTLDVCSYSGSVDDRIQRVLARRVRELAALY
jgi:SNF2 family DNA or RNA helicase